MRRKYYYFTLPILLLMVSMASAQNIAVNFHESTNNSLTAEEQSLIVEIAQSTRAEVAELLPELPNEIKLSVYAGRNVIPEIGIGASSVSPGNIEFVVDTTRPEGTESIVRTHLRSTLFHEMHHLTRGFVISAGDSFTSFMDAVVAEGMATVFEREFAGSDPLWGQYPDNARAWAEELAALPLSAYDTYGAWMFQHPDGRRWIGYRTGTYIIDQARAVSGLSSAEMVTMPTQEILRLVDL